MPNLPTLTVSDAQLARCLAVFGDAITYKAWLKSRLIDEVTRAELASIATRQNNERAAIVADVEGNVLP